MEPMSGYLNCKSRPGTEAFGKPHGRPQIMTITLPPRSKPRAIGAAVALAVAGEILVG
jgi:hypothetical protein